MKLIKYQIENFNKQILAMYFSNYQRRKASIPLAWNSIAWISRRITLVHPPQCRQLLAFTDSNYVLRTTLAFAHSFLV